MPVTHKDDKVWFDEVTKLEQICNQVSAAHFDGRSVLLLSHFEATLSRLSSMLREREIGHDRFSTFNPSELCAGMQGKVWMGSARAFQVATEMTSPADGRPLDILVAEHYPLQSRDQAVIDAAANLACDGQLCFHFSLDDPVMKHFGSDTIKALYERWAFRTMSASHIILLRRQSAPPRRRSKPRSVRMCRRIQQTIGLNTTCA